MAELNKASDIFMALRDNALLADPEEAEKSFGDDKELTKALIQRGNLRAIGVLR